jgi:hypothetical protein
MSERDGNVPVGALLRGDRGTTSRKQRPDKARRGYVLVGVDPLPRTVRRALFSGLSFTGFPSTVTMTSLTDMAL